MPFEKTQLKNSYYSRYQTPFRRRREGKTDYFARKRLVTQHKAKYGSPKFRLVVRFTKKDIICQIVTAHIKGDAVFTAAYAHELPRFGIKHGLTNWSAAYATGLLVARRALQKLGLDETYVGDEEHSGEFSLTEQVDDAPRPFKVFLDVGLTRTTSGARVFGALKGASDGGLYIPHSAKRFPGWDIESEELDADTLQKYIVGGHIAEYMEELADDDEERFRQIFSSYLNDGVEADAIEEIYSNAHEAIRADPSPKPTQKDVAAYKAESKKYKVPKLTNAQRKENIAKKIAIFRETAQN